MALILRSSMSMFYYQTQLTHLGTKIDTFLTGDAYTPCMSTSLQYDRLKWT